MSKKLKWPSFSSRNLEEFEDEETERLVIEKFVPVFAVAKEGTEQQSTDEHIVYGIVYEPDTEDAQGDAATAEEIKKAAYQFMEKVQVFKVNHDGENVDVKVLESYLAPVTFSIGKRKVKKGTWVLVTRVLDEKIWKAIKDGKLTGYSMAGYAKVG